MAKIITFGNFKGGTGKTTNSCLIAYHLALKGYKTLLIDLDPQANATSLLLKTRQSQTNEIIAFNTTLMTAINQGDLSTIISKITNNLYLLPSFADFTSYPLFLEKLYPDSQLKRAQHFLNLLNTVKESFDYIIFDTPPTVSLYTDSALMASKYVIIVLQTQERSYVGAEAFIKYLQELIVNYQANYEISGIIPVLLKNTSQVDAAILEKAKDDFDSENIFHTVVKNMERLKRYDMTGIIDPECGYQKHDMHDMRLHYMYDKLTDEFIKRVADHE